MYSGAIYWWHKTEDYARRLMTLNAKAQCVAKPKPKCRQDIENQPCTKCKVLGQVTWDRTASSTAWDARRSNAVEGYSRRVYLLLTHSTSQRQPMPG